MGDKATVKGTFSGVDKKTVYLDYITTNNIAVVDSAVTDEKGRFKFKVNIKSKVPSFYNIRYTNQTVAVLLSPGEDVEIKSLGNISRNYMVEGSENSELLKTLNTMMNRTRTQLDSLSEIYVQINENDEQMRKSILGEYTKIYLQQKRDLIKFIVTNPTSMASIYALYQKMPNGENVFGDISDMLYFKMVADSLSSHYPTSAHVISLQKDVAQMENTAKLGNMINNATQATTSFPDIDLPDMYGKRIKLSSIKNKVILLDFWVAQNNESRMANAELMEVYNKYAEKGFEIYQVSLDDSKPLWITTVQEQKLPWISVCDFNGVYSPAARAYNISSLPSNFLIDTNGRIVARNVPINNLGNRLDEIL